MNALTFDVLRDLARTSDVSLMRIEDERMKNLPPMQEPAKAAANAPASKHCGAGSAAIAVDPYGNPRPGSPWGYRRRPFP